MSVGRFVVYGGGESSVVDREKYIKKYKRGVGDSAEDESRIERLNEGKKGI